MESYYEALESFNKLKSPTVKSLFYSAATQAKLKNKEKAQETLSQAFTQSGLSLEQFIESQKYKNQEQTDDLCVTIGSIID